MKEDFLHYLWKYQLLSVTNLCTENKEELVVLKPGNHNCNSGPDFLNAHIKIGSQLWVGNVEIHLKSSDWYAHKHEIDQNYDAVILHVVWENDAVVFMKNNVVLPVLVLKNYVSDVVFNNYKKLFSLKKQWIFCEKEISKIESFVFENWKERLFFERLERKSEEMNDLLIANKNDFEIALFQLLAKNFGLKINADAFFLFAKTIDFSALRKVRFNSVQLEAMFFGQAGFLEEKLEEAYHQQLKNEFEYLKHKYQLKVISKNHFSFFRMRPANFPTIRMAQLVALYCKYQNLFSRILEIKKLDEFYELFKVEISLFWKMHYTFDTVSKKSPKNLTPQFIDLLLVNTIIPLKFLYQKNRGRVDESEFLTFFKKIKPEKNSIISKFEELGVRSKSSYETQALLELKNNYCSKQQCLKCAVGSYLLEKKESF